MNDEPAVNTNHNPSESAANRKATASESNPHGRSASAREFARRASEFAKSLPARVDDQVRKNPYTVLAAVGVAAAAAGVVMSSRVMRAVVTATMTAMALDVGRALVRQTQVRVEKA